MGNWDNFYYEMHEELTQLGMKQRFNSLLQELSTQDKFKYKSVRDRWNTAFKMIRNDEQ
ncbi:MAG: hypothetical protein ACJAR8_001237 [Bacteroidia bacterium]|jgi:hypothetical protein